VGLFPHAHGNDKESTMKDTEELLDEIEEIFNNHGTCEHDYEPKSSDYPGHNITSYSIDEYGRKKLRKLLKEGEQ